MLTSLVIDVIKCTNKARAARRALEERQKRRGPAREARRTGNCTHCEPGTFREAAKLTGAGKYHRKKEVILWQK